MNRLARDVIVAALGTLVGWAIAITIVEAEVERVIRSLRR